MFIDVETTNIIINNNKTAGDNFLHQSPEALPVGTADG